MVGFLFGIVNRASTTVRAYLPKRLQAMLWDFEYRRGKWSYLDGYDAGPLLALIGRYHPCGTILDLGCGTGKNFEPPHAYAYHGVDISSAAIRVAEESGRADATFEVADICSYEPTGKYDVILMREVLYYLPRAAVPGIIKRMEGALAPQGIIVVQIWDSHIYASTLNAVKRSPLIVAEQSAREDNGCTLVLTRRASHKGEPGA
jgi:2-polyprenyl-3-methyl-5-hydroxy-6-metoxy-1,4-benzoquinol methylase